jgi:NAD(P)-dependent dehydrogenase (short-subunit alcohol dehydrogenase family)
MAFAFERLWLTIGGARGIGAATVEFFIRHGALVEFADLNDANGFALQRQLEGYISIYQ